jgi:hypothetical protein
MLTPVVNSTGGKVDERNEDTKYFLLIWSGYCILHNLRGMGMEMKYG